MNITFLIGNGFDLNLNLKTRYEDFYKYYIKTSSATQAIADFKKILESDISKWSDFEFTFGQHAKDYENSGNDYVNIHSDVVKSLATYIQKQNKAIEISIEDKLKLKQDLINYDNYLSPLDKKRLSAFKKTITTAPNIVNVISFNYTTTFENLFSYTGKPILIKQSGQNQDILKTVSHIHGTTFKNLILGVFYEEQINSQKLQSSKNVQYGMIKSKIYKNTGSLIDEECEKYIDDANIICIFGMSLGVTDIGWWKRIVNKLLRHNCMLIIFAKGSDISELQGYRKQADKDKLIDKLFSYIPLSDMQKDTLKNKIIISLDTKMFKVSKQKRKTLNTTKKPQPKTN